jgi:uncharacterized protein YbjT (DUF2867 family)
MDGMVANFGETTQGKRTGDIMITVMGATGNTGRKITLGLLSAGQQVRALGRSEHKLAELTEAGAEAFVGDTSDPAFLANAFRDASAVYTLLPTDQRAPDYAARQREEGEAIVHAIRESGVRYVVALSCLGTDVDGPTGVIAGLRAQEHRLGKIENTNLLFLRAASFFENFSNALEVIRHQGVVADSVEPDLEIPKVATRDIAHAAVEALVARDWSGAAVREVIGPRDISYREATRILGERLGKPDLEYVQLPDADMAGALVGAGLSESFASLYVEMTRSFNEGSVQPLNGRTPANTTPTTFEAFAGELALAYGAVREDVG